MKEEKAKMFYSLREMRRHFKRYAKENGIYLTYRSLGYDGALVEKFKCRNRNSYTHLECRDRKNEKVYVCLNGFYRFLYTMNDNFMLQAVSSNLEKFLDSYGAKEGLIEAYNKWRGRNKLPTVAGITEYVNSLSYMDPMLLVSYAAIPGYIINSIPTLIYFDDLSMAWKTLLFNAITQET